MADEDFLLRRLWEIGEMIGGMDARLSIVERNSEHARDVGERRDERVSAEGAQAERTSQESSDRRAALWVAGAAVMVALLSSAFSVWLGLQLLHQHAGR
jgi:hypothetical protein